MSLKKELDQDLASILRNLQVAENNRDLRSIRAFLFEVLQLSNNGCDISSALPAVVKLLAHNDVFIKRVSGELIAANADRSPEMVLLATNTLVQDCHDLNPVVRSLGLRTLTSLGKSLPSIDVLNSAVTQGLEDKSPIVKQSAALACVNLHQLAPDAVTESGIWDRLYEHLSDSNAGTVTSCTCALENIFAAEKGLVVSNKLGQYLINALPNYTSVAQRLVLQFLLKHSPRKKTQVFEHLNDLDDHLSKSSSTATVLCALELFCHFSKDIQKVRDKVFSAAWASLKVNIGRERNEEVMTSVLDYLNTTAFPSEVMTQDYKMFYCRDDDAPFLIKKKSCLLSKLITLDNAENILKEFVSIVKSLDPASLSDVLVNITSHMGRKPEMEGMLVKFLQQLLEMGNKTVMETVIKILPSLAFCEEKNWAILAHLIESHHEDITSSEAEEALLYLLRMHSSSFDKAPDILEEILGVVKERSDRMKSRPPQSYLQSVELGGVHDEDCDFLPQLKLSLLSAMVHVSLDKPAKCQRMLAQFMEHCICDKNRVVRDRALFLYGYLFSEVRQKLLAVKS